MENQEVEMVAAAVEVRKIRKGVTRRMEIPADKALRNLGPQMEIKRLQTKHPTNICQIRKHQRMEMRNPMEVEQEERGDQAMS